MKHLQSRKDKIRFLTDLSNGIVALEDLVEKPAEVEVWRQLANNTFTNKPAAFYDRPNNQESFTTFTADQLDEYSREKHRKNKNFLLIKVTYNKHDK